MPTPAPGTVTTQQPQGQLLPWQTGSFAPWMVGQTFMGADGALYQVYPDAASQTGYTLKRTDQNGESFMTGPSPADPAGYARWFAETPEGKRLAAAEEAAAAQNEWNRSLQERQLQVQQDNSQQSAWYQRQQVEQAKRQLEAQIRGQDLTAGYQSLQLGASLRGPRDLWAYDRTAAAAGSNPLISNAVSTWANATNNRPTGGGSWNGGNPERMTTQALVSDMQGNPASAYTAQGSVTAMGAGGGRQQTLMALDEIARAPHRVAPGWWGSLNKTQQQMALGGWEETGHDVDTVLGRMNAGGLRNSVAGTRAA